MTDNNAFYREVSFHPGPEHLMSVREKYALHKLFVGQVIQVARQDAEFEPLYLWAIVDEIKDNGFRCRIFNRKHLHFIVITDTCQKAEKSADGTAANRPEAYIFNRVIDETLDTIQKVLDRDYYMNMSLKIDDATRNYLAQGLVPYSALHRIVSSRSAFRRYPAGATDALKRAIAELIGMGKVEQTTVGESTAKFYRLALAAPGQNSIAFDPSAHAPWIGQD